MLVSVRITWPPALIRSSSSSASVTCWTAATPRSCDLRGDEPDALAAAVLAPELGQRDALAVAGLGQDEQVAARVRRPSSATTASPALAQADADDAGYGKRAPIGQFRRRSRRPGRPLISLEGRKTGNVAAVQQVTEPDELLAPDPCRWPGHPDRDEHDQPLFRRRAA